MGSDAIDRWPSGERPTFFATDGAWEILRHLSRSRLTLDKKLRILAPFSTRDIRGAYFLTRDREELRRRSILVDGTDEGRAARISARRTLRRAFHQAQMMEETARLHQEAEAIIEEIRASPPAGLGYRQKTPRQVLGMASTAQPLSVRLRLLLEVRLQDLEDGLVRIQTLPRDRFLNRTWPNAHERAQIQRVLDLAIELQRVLG